MAQPYSIHSELTEHARQTVPGHAWDHYTLGRQHGFILGRQGVLADSSHAALCERQHRREQVALAAAAGAIVGAGVMYAVLWLGAL